MVEHLLCKPKALGSVLSSRNERRQQQQKRLSQAIRHHRDNYTAALFTIAKLSYENSLGAQQQSDAKKKRCAVYTMDCFPITKTEVTPLAGSWIQWEIIIVSELKSPQRGKYLLVLSLVVPRFYIDRKNHVGV